MAGNRLPDNKQGDERYGKPPRNSRIHQQDEVQLDNPVQTGASLKRLANIRLEDVLFLQAHGEDQVIANDATVTLKNGDHLHSQPAADYGFDARSLQDAGVEASRATIHPQQGGWSFLVIAGYMLPGGFQPGTVDLLIKMPPGFPDAQPDMFWVYPAVKTVQRQPAPRDLHGVTARQAVATILVASRRRCLAAGREHAQGLHALHQRALSADGLGGRHETQNSGIAMGFLCRGVVRREDVETAGVILAERIAADVLLARDLAFVPDAGYAIRQPDRIRIVPVALTVLSDRRASAVCQSSPFTRIPGRASPGSQRQTILETAS